MIHWASSKRASVSESSDFSLSLREGVVVVAAVGVGVAVPLLVAAAVEEDGPGAAVTFVAVCKLIILAELFYYIVKNAVYF